MDASTDHSTNDRTLRSVADLVTAGLVTEAAGSALAPVTERYAVALTPAMVALIDPADPTDPIARQFVPSPQELEVREEERSDPIGDETHSPVPGIVHRYPDRVLLKPVYVCPVYCRFCFRREMVGPKGQSSLNEAELEGALDYIRNHPDIWEVIVTGGDPLVLSPRRIERICAALGAIPHVRVIRWHSRVPVVQPEAVTAELVAALRSFPRASYVALHANHPREFSVSAIAAIARLVDGGIAMVSQTVLLKGVNDDVRTLGQLMRLFVENRVKPYYLHQGDLARGTSHFRTTIREGQALVAALRGNYSGLCQPTYVVDIPGGHGKSPIGPAYLGEDGRIRDYQGGVHSHPGCSG